jgi:protein-disulfide isomerase
VVTHRHLPLVNVHRNAYVAAKAADCAWQERRFWPMHDLLFADPKILNRSTIEVYGAKLGLGPAWKSCLADDANPNVDQDLKFAEGLGIESTPTFLIGRLEGQNDLRVSAVVPGLKPVGYFTKVINELTNPSLK